MAPQHMPGSWLPYSKFSARSTGWLAWATLKTLLTSSHVLSLTQNILCCIVAILLSTDAVAQLCTRRMLSSGIWKFRNSSFKCYVDHSHTIHSSGNIEVWNWVHLFKSCCIPVADSHIKIIRYVLPLWCMMLGIPIYLVSCSKCQTSG